MKKWLQEKLICPECISQTVPLDLKIREEQADEVLAGELRCPACGGRYPINDGIAVVLPKKSLPVLSDPTGYNSRGMLSAYLWSHYSEFFNGPDATDAYQRWASHFRQTGGWALDIGCSVGRLAFELTKTHSRVIGIDTSLPFIRASRELMRTKRLKFDLIVEGEISKGCDSGLDESWNYDGVDFIVADALALPFAENLFSTVTSINLLEKVPHPLQHLRQVNKVLRERNALFVFSDPFSWDAAVSAPELWLGGRTTGVFKGRGMENIRKLLLGEQGVFNPPFTIREKGDVVWKIRKTENLWEHIHSQFIIGERI